MKRFQGRAQWLPIMVVLILCVIIGSSCTPPNNPPVIKSLKLENDSIVPFSDTKVQCIASDVDGDDLIYNWSSTGGTISDNSPNATWTAPDALGTYTITVTVDDGRDGEATKQVTIDVKDLNHPPIIESLTADPKSITRLRTTNIECVANDLDGDKLQYQWSTNDGDLLGQGTSVIWKAPSLSGDYIVTVTVTDGKGGETTSEIEIRVIRTG